MCPLPNKKKQRQGNEKPQQLTIPGDNNAGVYSHIKCLRVSLCHDKHTGDDLS